jgi:hypothetical protein
LGFERLQDRWAVARYFLSISNRNGKRRRGRAGGENPAAPEHQEPDRLGNGGGGGGVCGGVPAYGQVPASNELRQRGVLIPPSGVRCVWLRLPQETLFGARRPVRDLDAWIEHCNVEQTHLGKMCCGQTRLTTVLAGEAISKE